MEMSSRLPPEIWLNIFTKLNTRDLCMVCLVSRQWRNITDNPKLWSKTRINKRKLILLGFPSLLTIPRFSCVRKLDLARSWLRGHQWHDVLTQIAVSDNPLEELDLSESNLSEVDIELLGDAVANSRKVKLAALQPEKILDWNKIFEKIAKSEVVQELDICDNLLSLVPTNLFISALGKLEKISLKNSLVTDDQLRNLLTRRQSGTQVTTSLMYGDLQSLPLDPATLFSKLSGVVVCLEDYSMFTKQVWVNMFTSIARSPLLKSLSLEGSSLSLVEVEPKLLTTSLSSLNHLRMSGVEMTSDQWIGLFSQLASPDCSLNRLSLRMVNLSSTPPSILSKALKSGHLNSLCLEYSVLTTNQWCQVLSSCLDSPLIRSLRVSNVNLAWSQTPPKLLSDLTYKLDCLDLSNTNLNSDQICHILKAVTESNNLKEINLQGLNLSVVSCQILATAVTHLNKVGLKKTQLTPAQVTSILVCNLSAVSRLRDLNLANINLSKVNGDTLAMSVTRLREVDLTCTWLTKDQTNSLANQIEKFTKLELLKLTSATVSLINNITKDKLAKQIRLVVH